MRYATCVVCHIQGMLLCCVLTVWCVICGVLCMQYINHVICYICGVLYICYVNCVVCYVCATLRMYLFISGVLCYIYGVLCAACYVCGMSRMLYVLHRHSGRYTARSQRERLPRVFYEHADFYGTDQPSWCG